MTRTMAIYYDYICPFCYILRRLMDRLEADLGPPSVHGLELEWRPLEIRPGTPEQGLAPEDLSLDEAYLETLYTVVEEHATRAGVTLRWPERLVNSRLALEVTEFARQYGRFGPVQRRLFEEYWIQGRDISRRELLWAVADEFGLPRTKLNDYLGTTTAARQLRGYQPPRGQSDPSVPTIVVDGQTMTGLQTYDALKGLISGSTRTTRIGK